MILRKFIPDPLLNYMRLAKVRKVFPNATIDTHIVGINVVLGKNVGVMRNVDLRDGVKISDYSYVSPGTIIASGVIGKFTSIGYNCQIGMFEHPTSHMSTSPSIYSDRSILGVGAFWEEIHSPPVIGNDVWIGSNSIILQGVEIGDGAIIAAGAVVTKNVEPFSIVGGVPAKFIKHRFGEDKIKYLINLRWWDLSNDEIRELKDVFIQKENWFNGQ